VPQHPTSSAFLPNLVVFVRLLRRAGLPVHTGRLLDAASALTLVGIRRRGDVHHALRTLLVHRHEDLALFDRAFDVFWRARGRRWGRSDVGSLSEQRAGVTLRFVMPGLDDEKVAGPTPTASGEPPGVPRRTWSAREALRQKNFARYTTEEIVAAARVLDRLRWHPGLRRTRRWVARRGADVDLRRLLRERARAGGDLAVLPRRTRRQRPRSIVVVADVSGSMERYTRMLLQFVHALQQRRRVEAFLFATRLTRVTHQLRTDRVDAAVRAISRAVDDWGGGTRIGEALRQLNVHWARRVLTRGPVVLIVSDGWDRGDPVLLARELARVRRSCHRLIWLNPLLGTDGYEPLTRGMAAARPYLDDFLPVHNLASLEALAAHLEKLPARRQLRRIAPTAI
jgi:uncharacterized protein with von Willebrand factor type A (vWA) domain